MAKRGQGEHGRRLSDAERLELFDRIAAGETQEEVAAALGCDPRTVIRWVHSRGGLRPYERTRSALRLSLVEREEISLGISRGDTATLIAVGLGRSVSTITREIKANGGRTVYRAAAADSRALRHARRPKQAKLATCHRLRVEVEVQLALRWSPQQISARLTVDFPDDVEMRVSHETIYQSLFIQARGALRRELVDSLRGGRGHRRPHGSTRGGGLRDMVSIAERPAEIEDRAIPGHWEGDLIIGKAGRSAIATLVERQSRFTMLLKIADGRTAESVRDALTLNAVRLPAALFRTLTWDQGKEMAGHVQFSVDTGIAVYFCDPSSPWQRGTNENTNGLLRQYFPKGTDLTTFTQDDLDAVADELNGRPRQTLGWMK
ncbi:MAG: IS30 family transposase, partial [Acidimicrobiia bacterium]